MGLAQYSSLLIHHPTPVRVRVHIPTQSIISNSMLAYQVNSLLPLRTTLLFLNLLDIIPVTFDICLLYVLNPLYTL
jgi:hypothetical protein